MKIDVKEFCVREGEEIKLKDWPAQVKRYYSSKKQLKKPLGERIEEMSDLQSLLYASNRYAVLLIFQAMEPRAKTAYEEVLIVRVHPELLRAEGASGRGTRRENIWQEHY